MRKPDRDQAIGCACIVGSVVLFAVVLVVAIAYVHAVFIADELTLWEKLMLLK